MKKKKVKRTATDGQVYDGLSDPTIFADLFNGSLFGGEQILNAEMLRPYNEKKLQRIRTRMNKLIILMRLRDNEKIADFPEGQLAVILATENQRHIHYAMPVKNMVYDCMDYVDQINTYTNKHGAKKDLKGGAEFLSGLKKNDKLAPVLTIVFYYGEDPWDGPNCLHDMIDFPPKLLPLKQHFPNYSLNLVSCSTVDPGNFKTGLSEVFELLRYADSKQGMNDFLEQRKEHYEHLDAQTYDLISRFLDIPTLAEQSIGDITQEGGFDMCTAIKEMINDGRLEGMAMGKAAGKAEGKAVGKAEGISYAEDRYNQLLKLLLKDNRFHDIQRITEDHTFRQELYREFGFM